MTYDALHLEDNETVLLEVRKHWIVFIGHIVSFFFFVLLPVFLCIGAITYAPPTIAHAVQQIINKYFKVFLFFYFLDILFLWIGFFMAWTKYFLDVWYVTGTRIIVIEQQRLFSRNISNIRFDKIQDITVHVNGFLATMLNFGDIRVQTASENEEDFIISTVRNPEHVKQIIFSQHNFIGDRRELPSSL